MPREADFLPKASSKFRQFQTPKPDMEAGMRSEEELYSEDELGEDEGEVAEEGGSRGGLTQFFRPAPGPAPLPVEEGEEDEGEGEEEDEGTDEPGRPEAPEVAGFKTVDDITGVSKQDMDYLVGGLDDPFVSGARESDLAEITGVPEADKEFLFGVPAPPPQSRTRYIVGKRKLGRRLGRVGMDKDTGEFLFGTKGVL